MLNTSTAKFNYCFAVRYFEGTIAGENNTSPLRGQFELEDAGRVATRPSSTGPVVNTAAAEATVTLPLRRPPSASSATATTTTTTTNTNSTNTNNTSSKEESRAEEKERDRDSGGDGKAPAGSASPASTQAALNVIQRRRRPKRRSTGVGHVDMDDIVNDRGGGGEGDGDIDNAQWDACEMSRKPDRYSSRPRSYGSSPSVFGSMFSSQYSPYTNNYSNSYTSSSYRNYNPYTVGLGRPSNLGIYGGTSSGYGGVYLSSATLGSLNLMTPVLKKLDKKILASQKNFKPKPVPPAKVQEAPAVVEAVELPETPEAPPVRPERRSRSGSRGGGLNKERSRSLTALDSSATLNSRSLSLNSLASDGYCSGSERTDDGEEKDYKALYEASQSEVRRLRALLTTSEQQLREARATIGRLTQVNQNSLSEIDKREKRAMERKLSEMEEELKQLQKLKAENERLRAENRALTRVVSKLTNSAAK
ncbi:unnamed protein product, partial [Iphiclides podalirius]